MYLIRNTRTGRLRKIVTEEMDDYVPALDEDKIDWQAMYWRKHDGWVPLSRVLTHHEMEALEQGHP